jgi:hypothetical protein
MLYSNKEQRKFLEMIKKIYHKLPDALRKNKVIEEILATSFMATSFFDKDAKVFSKNAELYCKKHENIPFKKLKKDMFRMYIKQGIDSDEYVKFQLFDRSGLEKAEYFSLNELRYYFKNNEKNHFPGNKYDRYLMFQQFFKREIIDIKFDESTEENVLYQEFCKRHAEFIIKPTGGTKGHGVQKVTSSMVADLKDLYIIAGGECMLEEVIQQGEELAKFHPYSVNTVRFVTGLNEEGELTDLYALLRTGKSGSVVDNVGSGGFVALIDIKSGRIVTDGLNGTTYYEHHPDTNIKFNGNSIPAWNELCTLAEIAHRTMPNQLLIGWDFAWTGNGWDLVEANPAPSFASYQTLAGKGIRPELVKAGLL